MTPVELIAKYTTVDMGIITKADFTCDYDEMKFAATFRKQNSASRSKGRYGYSEIDYDIRMVWTGSGCLLLPRLTFKNNAYRDIYGTTNNTVYIKNGENRYVLTCDSQLIDSDNYTRTIINVGTLRSTGVTMLRDIVSGLGQYLVSFQCGDTEKVEVSPNFLIQSKQFLSVCEESGIFAQEGFEAPDNYQILTKMNP